MAEKKPVFGQLTGAAKATGAVPIGCVCPKCGTLRTDGDPHYHQETNILVVALQDRVESAERTAHGLRRLQIANFVQDRLVVLVDQHDDRPTLVVKPGDHPLEGAPRLVGIASGQRYPVPAAPVGKLRHEVLLEACDVPHIHRAHVEPQHGRWALGLLRHPPLGGQALEQLDLPPEHRIERRERQRLAEPPRAGQEVPSSARDDFLKPMGLVNIEQPIPAQHLEALDAYGQGLKLFTHRSSPLPNGFSMPPILAEMFWQRWKGDCEGPHSLSASHGFGRCWHLGLQELQRGEQLLRNFENLPVALGLTTRSPPCFVKSALDR